MLDKTANIFSHWYLLLLHPTYILLELVPYILLAVYLQILLPQLVPLLTDNSLLVREEMCRLLLSLNSVPNLSWEDVVSVDLALEVMLDDEPAVRCATDLVLLVEYY